MAYSSLPEGRGVNCLLLGGPQGRLVWLNSWTLDTIQVIQVIILGKVTFFIN
ncbi:unnamed protein product [Protopolystoma xenopodis]|uniref:Uncharacterized protein n=1 Tax=Protopolystoma xenopodis TaxID=117903 RepID=A0A3S5FFC4_9PLAT|nr:unnamed protein product [Protopolystoma xenopodis]